jgi:hypothetical protein
VKEVLGILAGSSCDGVLIRAILPTGAITLLAGVDEHPVVAVSPHHFFLLVTGNPFRAGVPEADAVLQIEQTDAVMQLL